MNTLVSALYAEGRSDERFLPPLLQRTLAALLNQHAERAVDVLDPLIVRPVKQPTHEECILAAAQQAAGCHLLFVHADADERTSDRAYVERIEPGLSMVQSAGADGIAVCRHIVPVVPVQMVEAWLLADAEALYDVVGVADITVSHLIPAAAHEIEGLSNPKARLLEIVRQAQAQRPRRRRSVALGEYYEPLANRIELHALRRLSAYRRLEEELHTVLQQLGFTRR